MFSPCSLPFFLLEETRGVGVGVGTLPLLWFVVDFLRIFFFASPSLVLRAFVERDEEVRFMVVGLSLEANFPVVLVA